MSVSQWSDDGINGNPALGNELSAPWRTRGRSAKTARVASRPHHFRGGFDPDTSLFCDIDGVVVDTAVVVVVVVVVVTAATAAHFVGGGCGAAAHAKGCFVMVRRRRRDGECRCS